MENYIYFGRSSFCMGDDVCAPNMRRFEYLPETFSEIELQECITNYFTSNLPRFEWQGFCNGEPIVRVVCAGDEDNYIVTIEPVENWCKMLEQRRTIFFDHNTELWKLGEKESKYYSQEKAEEVFNRYHR